MLIKEFYKFNERFNENSYKTYSDENYFIQQISTGNLYEEAIDLESKPETYIETNIKIEEEENNEEEN